MSHHCLRGSVRFPQVHVYNVVFMIVFFYLLVLFFFTSETILENEFVADSPCVANSPCGKSHSYIYQQKYTSSCELFSFICVGILFESFRAAIKDKGFHLPSVEAQAGLATAVSLFKWATVPSNRDAFELSAHKSIEQLKALIQKKPTSKACREKTWVNFSKYWSVNRYGPLCQRMQRFSHHQV